MIWRQAVHACLETGTRLHHAQCMTEACLLDTPAGYSEAAAAAVAALAAAAAAATVDAAAAAVA